MNGEQPSIGIAILNWNGKYFLQSLLPMLRRLTYTSYAVYVIDNNSSDDSISFIRAEHPEVKIIINDDNYGFSEGYNRGIAGVNEDYFLMMNSDVEVGENFLQPLVCLIQSDVEIAICQPKILAQRSKTMFEHAGAAGGMIDLLGYPFCRGRLFDSVEQDLGQYDDVKQIFWATGTCCLIKKEAYWSIGGMYGYYFMHMEEIDMCWRLNSAGYKIMYCPESYIYHLGGGSLSYQSSRKIYYNFRNNIIMCFRNSPWHVNCWLLPFRFIMDMIAALKFTLDKDFSSAGAVAQAYAGFFQWLFGNTNNKFPHKKKSLMNISIVFKKSIVWQYYIKRITRYSDIN